MFFLEGLDDYQEENGHIMSINSLVVSLLSRPLKITWHPTCHYLQELLLAAVVVALPSFFSVCLAAFNNFYLKIFLWAALCKFPLERQEPPTH